MTSSLLPYSSYKKSDVPWLKEIPEQWCNQKLWTISSVRNEKNPGDLPLLSVFLHKGVIYHHGSKGQTHAPSLDLSNYQVVRRGDFVLNNQQAWRGSVGVSSYDGIISPAYVVLKLSPIIDFQFADYLFQNHTMVDQYVISSKGVGDIQRQVYWQYLKNVQTPLPPLDEQRAIVKYLDYVDKRIKKYIRAKQKQIKFLEEMKQAIIHQAVTRGLDSTIPLKPSGVDWLGEIPAHWEVLPGKLCLREKKTPNKGNEISKVLSLSYGKIIERPEEKLHGLVPSSFETYQVIEEDDIIVRSTDLQNDHVSWRFGLCTQQGIITSAYLCLQATTVITANFSYYLLHNYDITKDIYRFGSGLRQNLSWTDFKYLPIIVPPMNEQIQIVEYLDDIDYEYSQISMVLKNQINIIKELKDKLVADVVTGKLDVREAANQLPDEIEELLDEPDETLEEELENGEEMEEVIPEEE